MLEFRLTDTDRSCYRRIPYDAEAHEWMIDTTKRILTEETSKLGADDLVQYVHSGLMCGVTVKFYPRFEPVHPKPKGYRPHIIRIIFHRWLSNRDVFESFSSKQHHLLLDVKKHPIKQKGTDFSVQIENMNMWEELIRPLQTYFDLGIFENCCIE